MAAGPRADVASFLSNTEVRDTDSSRGRGLFATCDLKFGDPIIVEKAFCALFSQEEGAFAALKYDVRQPNDPTYSAIGFCKEVIAKITRNSSQAKKILDLHGRYPGIGNDAHMVDGHSVVDTFQLHDIISRNTFGKPNFKTNLEPAKVRTGLWVRSSYLNHSCVPNSKRAMVGDLLIPHATKPIAIGEEITFSYDDGELHEFKHR